METIDQHWRKSSYSGNGGGNCIEVARIRPVIAVRDSKDPHGPNLIVGPASWRTFTASIKAGTLGRS